MNDPAISSAWARTIGSALCWVRSLATDRMPATPMLTTMMYITSSTNVTPAWRGARGRVRGSGAHITGILSPP